MLLIYFEIKTYIAGLLGNVYVTFCNKLPYLKKAQLKSTRTSYHRENISIFMHLKKNQYIQQTFNLRHSERC